MSSIWRSGPPGMPAEKRLIAAGQRRLKYASLWPFVAAVQLGAEIGCDMSHRLPLLSISCDRWVYAGIDPSGFESRLPPVRSRLPPLNTIAFRDAGNRTCTDLPRNSSQRGRTARLHSP